MASKRKGHVSHLIGTFRQFSTECGNRNISFSGSGFLCVFHLGVASSLIKRNIIGKDSKFAGASGGALVAASLACDIPISKSLEGLAEVASICRKNGTIGKVEVPLMALLKRMIPDNAPQLCSDRVQIAVSRIYPDVRSPVLVKQYFDRNDLLSALKCSCFVPFYLSNSVSVRWRNGLYVDGGFAQLVPIIPSYVMVLVFKPETIRPILSARVRHSPDLISPSLVADFPFSLPQLFHKCLLPSSDREIQELYEWGQKVGDAWSSAA